MRAFAVARNVAARPALSAYWLAWLATATFFAGFYALLVPLPRYLAVVGLPDWQIGLVLGAFGIASLVGRPLAGTLTDQFGAKPVMLIGAASLGLGALGTPHTASLPLLIALRLLQAIGYVAFTTAGTALIVSLVPPDARASRLAVFGAAANVAISLTPAAVSALLTVAPLDQGFLVAGAFATIGGVLALSLPAARTDSVKRPGVTWFPGEVWLPMLVTALLGAGFAAFFQFAPILGDRRGVPSGVLYTIYGATIIATRVIGGRVLDRVRINRVVAIAAVLMALGHAVLASTDALLLVLLAPVLVATGGGLFHPALIAHHAALLPETPGKASAAFYVAFDLGIGLGSWLLGAMLQWAGVPGLYWSAAVLASGALLLAPRLRERV
ncbi:MAG: MFS transporter [Chloroflexi bacterium]|nr:MFS transporter [Chloroflexota bacterium]